MSASACPAGRDPPASDRHDWWRPGSGLRAALLALFALVATPAFAQAFPKFTGLVVDAASILPADRKAGLEAKLEDFQQRTGRQFVVATIPDLQGYAIEDYGYRLGRNWGVGLKDADNGAILIVAPKERKVRIEVGRRLEPVLTDAFSSVIVQTKILPAFKAGDLPAGVDAGAAAIIDQLGKPDAQAQAEAAAAAKRFDAAHKESSSGGPPIGLIFWGMVIGLVVLAMARRKAGGRRYRNTDGGGSNWPIWLWAASELLDGNRNGGGGSGGLFGGGGSGSSGGSDGGWGGGGFTGGGGGDFGGGGASGDW